MIAELAAFNAGFSVVKQFIANGRDLSDAMGAIGQMVGAKEDLKRRGEKRKRVSYLFLVVRRKTILKSLWLLKRYERPKKN